MIDSHCHLDHDPLYENIDDVILRSKNAGITKLLTICTNLESFENIKKIINIDPIIYGTFGIHPHDADKYLITKSKIVENSKYSKKIIGVGETGLDFYYNNSERNNQIKSFENHIEASLDLNLPIIVHSRSAEDETFEIFASVTKTGSLIVQVANSNDVMVGGAKLIDDTSDNVVGFETVAASDTITLNGSTTGGVTFSKIVCEYSDDLM